MSKIREIMTSDPITLSPETEIVPAAKLLLERRINGAPVVDREGRLVGILCQSDLIAQQKKIPLPSVFVLADGLLPLVSQKHVEQQLKKIAALTVSEAMTPDPVTVGPEMEVEEAATLMVDRNFHTLPVVEGGRLVGVVGKEDILRTLLPSSSE